jgi:hypothetical protein
MSHHQRFVNEQWIQDLDYIFCIHMYNNCESPSLCYACCWIPYAILPFQCGTCNNKCYVPQAIAHATILTIQKLSSQSWLKGLNPWI